MANNGDDQRRNIHRPEDNPFIAFRRYADSQVSSLLNTIFTLPAAIANHNNAYVARERCLFGKADQRECEKLAELEAEITDLRREGRELFRTGEIEEVIKKSEEFIKLNAKAEEIRRGITKTCVAEAGGENDKELVQRVGNKKGQEWGWSWDWGFPRPFDHEAEDKRGWSWGQREAEELVRLQQEVDKLFAEEEGYAKRYNQWVGYAGSPSDMTCRERLRGRPFMFHSRGSQSQSAASQDSLHVERDAKQAAFDRRAEHLTNTLEPQDEYAPKALERDTDMHEAGVHWVDAFRDLVRHEMNGPQPDHPLAEHRQHQKMCPYNPHAVQSASQEEDMNYEYEHDHEDQHDDPPTPKVQQTSWARNVSRQGICESEDDRTDMKTVEDQAKAAQPATELDVYEGLIGQPQSSGSPWVRLDKPADAIIKPSVLSTLTTTERSVAPDGSVTTKIVLKKRFADGREESSETVHTQRGQSMEFTTQPTTYWSQHQPEPAQRNTGNEKSDTSAKDGKLKKGGWFWSS